jgi:methyl coenzyme M reductase subunit D
MLNPFRYMLYVIFVRATSKTVTDTLKLGSDEQNSEPPSDIRLTDFFHSLIGD